MARGYLVWGYVDKEGKHFIDVNPFYQSDPDNLRAYIKTKIQHYQDWQCSMHDTLQQVKSCIMSCYGIDWFNRARLRLRNLEKMGV